MNVIRTLVPVLFLLVVASAATGATGSRLSVDGTAFVLADGHGRTLRGAELVGAELDLGDGITLRIDGVRVDPQVPSGEVLLHRFSLRVGEGVWENPCEPDREGRQEGLPLAGRWDADGRFRVDATRFALSCTSGAQAKCVRFGYLPWKRATDGTALAPLYEACVRMVRADYCGNGEASTRDGMAIDIFDRHGIQTSEGGADFRFEAGWSAQGAVCVAHTRVVDKVDLDALATACPRLRGALGKECSEERAHALGALVYNRSR